MKKYSYLLMFLLVSVLLKAQSYTNANKLIIVANTDTLLKNYLQKSSLIEEGTTKQSDKVLREFKNLFASDAQIFDDILPVFDSTQIYGYPYKLKTKTFKEYYSGLVYEFPEGLTVNNKKININYAELDKGIIKVALERVLKGTSATKKYILFNHDSLMLTLAVQPDKKVKIKSIAAIGSPLIQVLNDKDYDGVIDSKDECPGDKGKMYLKGCPDKDNDGIPDKNDECPSDFGPASNGGCPPSTFAYRFVLSAGIGYQWNKNSIKTPSENLGYLELDKERFDAGKFSNPGFEGGFTINGNICYYFGKNKNNRNKGLSLGISVYNYKADYSISGSHYEFKSVDGGNDPYRRIISLKEAKEKAEFYIVNLPLLFRYKQKLNTKLAFELGVGSGVILFSSKSEAQAKIDFEGIYKFQDGQFIYDQHYVYDKSDLFLIKDSIHVLHDEQLSKTQLLFEMLKESDPGYDFSIFDESRQPYTATSERFQRIGISGNACFDLFYHVTPKLALKTGATFVYAPFKSKASAYKIADKADGTDYQSFLESRPKSNYFGYGIILGIILGI